MRVKVGLPLAIVITNLTWKKNSKHKINQSKFIKATLTKLERTNMFVNWIKYLAMWIRLMIMAPQ